MHETTSVRAGLQPTARGCARPVRLRDQPCRAAGAAPQPRPAQQTAAGGIACTASAGCARPVEVEGSVYFQKILLDAGFRGRLCLCYCCQRTESFRAAGTKSFIPENQGCARNVVLVWDLFRKKQQLAQRFSASLVEHRPVCVGTQQQNAFLVLVSGF